MKRWFSMFALALSIVGCAPASDDSPQESASQSEVEESGAALTASPIDIVTLDPAPVEFLPGWGDESTPDALGTLKCTSLKQKACDACVDGCDYLCDRANGGGQAGECIGLFCPTRCDQCVLSCFQTCGKCIPSQF